MKESAAVRIHDQSLDRLMKDARARKFDVVIVARFDRFARSVSHLLRALEEFNHLGIDFVSLSESIDTSTPMGKMIFTVLGAVAELERNLIKERVHDREQAQMMLRSTSVRQVARQLVSVVELSNGRCPILSIKVG